MTAVTTTTQHRVLMSDVDLVQVNYTRMFLWMDHRFTQLLHDLHHPQSTLLRQGATGCFARGECRHVWIRTHPRSAAVELPDWLRLALVPREAAISHR